MPVPGHPTLFFWIIYRSAVTIASVLLRHPEEVISIVLALLETHSNRAAPGVTKLKQQALSLGGAVSPQFRGVGSIELPRVSRGNSEQSSGT